MDTVCGGIFPQFLIFKISECTITVSLKAYRYNLDGDNKANFLESVLRNVDNVY